MTFVETAELILMGCPGLPYDSIPLIMEDCKLSIRQRDPFGWLDEAQQAGRRLLAGTPGLNTYAMFEDFNSTRGKLELSMALRNSVG